MKKYVLWPLLAAIGGVGAFLLRLLQRSTGFDFMFVQIVLIGRE